MRICLALFLVFSLMVAFSGIVQAQMTEEQRIQQLEDLCKKQQERIQNLQGSIKNLQNEESYKQYTEQIVQDYLQTANAQEDDGITAGYDNGFFISSADGKMKLTINGYLQAGVGIFENNTFDNNSFYLNGAFLSFDILMFEKWHAVISIDFAGSPFYNQFQNADTYGVTLLDSFIEYKLMPELNFRVGNTHVPFGIEGQYSAVEGLSIWSEPFTASWSHGRDVGFMIHGLIKERLEYKVGIFNGDGSNRVNGTDDMLLAGQLRFYLCSKERNPNSFIHVGFLRGRDNTEHNSDFGSALIASPWGRPIFDGELNTASPTPDDDATQGWRTAVDAGARVEFAMDNGSAFRLEGEFMYSTWERKFTSGRLSWLRGYGYWFGGVYRHCFDKNNEGSGLMVGGKFSYTDVDNEGGGEASGDIRGQLAYTYTAILGYAFNKYMAVNFNWIFMDLNNRQYYGGTKLSHELVTGKGSGLENAWFLQFTAMW